jgi:hypothetical protein
MERLGSDWAGPPSSKARTDHYPSIDVRQMAREFRLGLYVVLAGGMRVSLEWRTCHFGGARVYFICPRCGGRSCILYRFKIESKRADQYGCQKCLDMTHPVENEGKLERAVRRNHKAINRHYYDPSRPKGKPIWMRWLTWRRLSEQFALDVMCYFDHHEKILMLARRAGRPKPPPKRRGSVSAAADDSRQT